MKMGESPTAEQIADARHAVAWFHKNAVVVIAEGLLNGDEKHMINLDTYCAELVEASTALAKKARDYYEGTDICDIDAMKVLGIVAKWPEGDR